MGRIIVIFWLLILVAFAAGDTYVDGVYNGTSRSVYVNEPYFGTATIVISNGKFSSVSFFIRDSVKHEWFDEKYERHFEGNEQYIQQCRNDLKGVRSYPETLLKCQDPDEVDCMSGATWSYNIFRASVEEALKKAVKDK